jgi:hypothetical protein
MVSNKVQHPFDLGTVEAKAGGNGRFPAMWSAACLCPGIHGAWLLWP